MIGAKDIEDSESKGLFDYEYSEPQVFFNSNKLIFNARTDSMFLSSFKDVIVGAGNTVEIISENETIIESSNIYLGKQAKQLKILTRQMREMPPPLGPPTERKNWEAATSPSSFY